MSRGDWKTVRIQYMGGIPTSDNFLEHFQKKKRLIVESFPRDRLVEGMIPVGLLVRDLKIERIDQVGTVRVDIKTRSLYRVKRCRPWVKGKASSIVYSFLVDFELASEEETAVHEVMTK